MQNTWLHTRGVCKIRRAAGQDGPTAQEMRIPVIPPSYTLLPNRFWTKVDELGEGDCWLWLGTINKDGEPQFHYQRRAQLAHYLSAADAKGPAEPDAVLGHTCGVSSCIRPSHVGEE